MTFSATLATVPYSITSLWPEDASKLPASSLTAARIAPPLSTFNSVELAAPADKMVSAAMIAIVRVVRFSTVPRRFSEDNSELQRAAAALLLHRLSTVGAGRLSAHIVSV